MDNETKQKLIVIAAVFIAAIAFYYLASPYQNCIRDAINEGACIRNTRW